MEPKEKPAKLEKTSKNLSSIRNIFIDLMLVATIFILGLLIFKELSKDTVVIDPFQVPTDLEKMNITGQALANKLIDQIENIKSNADTSYKKFDVTPVYYDSQLEIVIPGSGISLKSLLNNIKIFLGRKQKRISGEVVLNKKLFLTIRVQGEPSKTFSGELDGLDSIMKEAAQYVLKYTQPYLLAYYLYYNYDEYSKNKEQALEMIKYSLSHLPKEDDPMAYTLDGYIKWEEKKFDESIKSYKKALELEPKYVDAYNGWAYSLYEEKKYDEAADIYKKALRLDQDYPYTYHYIGLNLYAQGKSDSAEEYYKKTIQLDPNYDEVYVDYGKLLLKNKKLTEAGDMFEKAIDLDQNSFDAYSGLGEIYFEQKRFDEAISMFNKSIDLRPDFAESYFGAGNVFSEQNKFSEANEMYKKAIKLDSTNSEAYNKLGLNLEEEKKYAEAVEVYKRAKENIPSGSEYFNIKIEELKSNK